jgi:hypothetical protein
MPAVDTDLLCAENSRLVITGLYVGRDVLLPLAFAILLSFVLTIVVASTFALIFALGWLMSQQATQHGRTGGSLYFPGCRLGL